MDRKFLSIYICSSALGSGHEEVWQTALNVVERPACLGMANKWKILAPSGCQIRVLALQKHLVQLVW